MVGSRARDVTWWRAKNGTLEGKLLRKTWRYYMRVGGHEALNVQYLSDSGKIETTSVRTEFLIPCPEGPTEEEELAWTLAILQS